MFEHICLAFMYMVLDESVLNLLQDVKSHPAGYFLGPEDSE